MNAPVDRAELRARRREVARDQGRAAARALAEVARGWSVLEGAARVAGYVAVDGELDPAPVLAQLASAGATVHLPVLAGASLRFGATGPDVEQVPNRFGIPEPTGVELVGGEALDVVLVPLVAADVAGNRVGFGAGYYDRTFAFLVASPRPARPVLVGVAFDLQIVDALDAAPWDVPLDAVLTPTRRIGISVPAD